TTVLAKASIPLLVVPLLTSAVAIGMYWVMLLLSSAVVLGSGQSVATLWTQVSFLQMSLLLLYHIFTAHTLWPAPIYGWLLLVSGWARRATFLWAALPLLAIGIFERIRFVTWHFGSWLMNLLTGSAPAAFKFNHPYIIRIDSVTQLTLIR